MYTAITEGVKVCVEAEYQPQYSNPPSQYVFTYRITIENQSDFTVKLLRRHWFIFDSCGLISEVEGEGVVGLQPVIAPGALHRYSSACHLTTDIGKMRGFFIMEKHLEGTTFKVAIPEFVMIEPSRLN
jgi:ApaG protein